MPHLASPILANYCARKQGMEMVATFGCNPPEALVKVTIKDLEPKPRFVVQLPGSSTVAKVRFVLFNCVQNTQSAALLFALPHSIS